METTPIIGMVSLAAMLVFSGCKPVSRQPDQAASPSAPGGTVVAKGTSVLTLRSWSEGSPVNLEQYAGKDLLLVFFAPWADSGPAVVEWISDLSTVQFEVFPVVIDRREGEAGQQADFMSGLIKPVFAADDALLASLGGIRALPTAVWITSGTTVAGTWAGFPSFTGIVDSITGALPVAK